MKMLDVRLAVLTRNQAVIGVKTNITVAGQMFDIGYVVDGRQCYEDWTAVDEEKEAARQIVRLKAVVVLAQFPKVAIIAAHQTGITEVRL